MFFVLCTLASTAILVGFKTRHATIFMAVLLFCSDILGHIFGERHESFDAISYFFLQDLSIFGGFLVLASLGPGGLSVDEGMKKTF